MDRQPSIRDPDGRSWRDGSRLADLNAERVLVCAPDADVSRTRDVIQLDLVREHIPLTAIVTSEALELRLPTLEWLSPHTPAISSRLCKRVLWKTLGTDVRMWTRLSPSQSFDASEST